VKKYTDGNKINFIGNKIICVFLFLLWTFMFIINSVDLSSSFSIDIESVVVLIILLFCFLYYLTYSVTFDDTYFTIHFLFYKKQFLILSFTSFKYFMFGCYIIRLRIAGSLTQEGTIFVGSCSRREMEKFFSILRKKNLICEIS
jgi:hypothetical protein